MEAEESDKWKWRVWFWEETYPCNDQFLLQWEVPMLLELGKSVRNIVSKAGSMMAQVITNQNPASHNTVCLLCSKNDVAVSRIVSGLSFMYLSTSL